jgi:thiol-disulfide isomerase/thioredoxin
LKRNICCLILLWGFSATAQNEKQFTLEGTINQDSGTMFIYPVENSPSYPNTFDIASVPVQSGKFRFAGKIEGPFEIKYLVMSAGGENKYLSGSFYIEPGIQTIICHVDSLREIPEIHNASMTEFTQKFLTPAYYDFDNIQNWEESKRARRNYIYEYAKENPESYVALWEIGFALDRGYNKQLSLAYDALSEKIRNTNTGRIIKKDLYQMSLIDTGQVFPTLAVLDSSTGARQLSFTKTGSKYTIVDFWFSHCGPCLGQFPNYLKLFNLYRNKGFNIVGISNDSSKNDVDAWKKVIQSHGLVWTQYRTGPEVITNLRITGYPTSFLLDGSGKIVAKDLDTNQLAEFLKMKLN